MNPKVTIHNIKFNAFIFNIYVGSCGSDPLHVALLAQSHLYYANGLALLTSVFAGFISRVSCCTTVSFKMALLTPLFAFLYHLPQVYKWLLKPYYVASLFMSVAFLAVRKTPGICDRLATQREDGNSCDFDWVRRKSQKVWSFSRMC